MPNLALAGVLKECTCTSGPANNIQISVHMGVSGLFLCAAGQFTAFLAAAWNF